MLELISNRVARRYYLAQLFIRPTLAYALTACVMVITFTVCYMLLTQMTTIPDAAALLMSIIGAIVPVLTALVVGKSYERGKGIRDDAAIYGNTPRDRMNDFRDEYQGYRGRGYSGYSNDDDAEDQNPLAVLNSMNLDDYMPKVADDKPQVAG